MDPSRKMIAIIREYPRRTGGLQPIGSCSPAINTRVGITASYLGPATERQYFQCEAMVLNPEGNGVCLWAAGGVVSFRWLMPKIWNQINPGTSPFSFKSIDPLDQGNYFYLPQ
jgi:hypothetical protein